MSVLTAIALTGCSLAPDLPPAPQSVPTAYLNTPVEAATAQTAALSWQVFFQEPRLQQLLTQALAQNHDLKLAVLNVERVRSLYQITDSNRYPALDLSASQSRQRLPADLSQNGSASISQQASVTVGSSWELDLFGKVRNQSEQALQQLFASEAAQRAATISLLAEVAGSWYSYASNLQLLTLAQHSAASYQQSLQLTERKVALGAASELTLSQQQSLLATSQADAARYQRLLQRDLNALKLLLAQPEADLNALLPSAQEQLTLPELAAGSPSLLLTQRPDIQQAEHQLKAANANIGVARAAFFPSISLTASAGTASNELSGLFNGGSGSWSFVPNISLPIFNMGRTQANLQLAETDRTIALETYQQKILQAFRDVSDQLADKAGYQAQLSALQELEHSSFRSKQLSQARFDAGVDSYLQLLDAERSWYSARQQLSSARLSYQQAQLGLYKALGGGWQDQPGTTTTQ
ncbi:MAG: efflux transporter outer membrane subunit [Rheinheimera sp.]|nr:efflux transporter outer membrane subunit [Rheinheimera sp.]